MKAITIAVLVVMMAGVLPCRADNSAQALKDLRDAKLGQIALLVKDLSQGKSRLVIGDGATARPRVGHAVQAEGALPFITAYPVSAPVVAELGAMGECVVVGAIALGVQAEPPGARDSRRLEVLPAAPPGVYLLAYSGKLSDQTDGSGTVFLVSVSVDSQGNATFRQALGVSAKESRERVIYKGDRLVYECSGLPPAPASVRFPDKDQVSKNNPAWRATVTLALPEPDGTLRIYSFQLDLQIYMV